MVGVHLWLHAPNLILTKPGLTHIRVLRERIGNIIASIPCSRMVTCPDRFVCNSRGTADLNQQNMQGALRHNPAQEDSGFWKKEGFYRLCGEISTNI